MNPHEVTKQFEKELALYTGAKYAVTTTSCTMALLLACAYHKVDVVSIPRRTYISVPMSIIHAGGRVIFRNEKWSGMYQLKPYSIYDCARLFTGGMYKKGQYQCVSFHASKILCDTQGGAILHDSPEADKWFRKARFDGRTEGVTPKDDTFDMLGYHCYMSVDVAARLLWKLSVLPKHNKPLPNDPYPDLSKIKIFQNEVHSGDRLKP
jgi:dTDP-4-amino-4,6-dideoxygalactose transaminase